MSANINDNMPASKFDSWPFLSLKAEGEDNERIKERPF